jgi:alkaline phosphatase D
MQQGIDRRAFVGRAAASAAGLALAVPSFAEMAAASATRTRAKRAPRAGDVLFRQGVAAGEPAPDAITLWTRVDGLDRTSRLDLEVARDPHFRRVVERREVVADERANFTVKERVEGLEPRERYYYRFEAGGRDSRVGRFLTAPVAGSREPVRIGFFSCQAWEAGYYAAHAGLAEEELDLVVCLGDYVYERSYYEDGGGVRFDHTGANHDAEVQTLSEYRDKYALYHTDDNLRLVRERHAMMAIFDDHEVEDNWTADRPGEKTIDKRVPFKRRRRNGLTAFFEHVPIRQRPGERFRIYDRFRYGRNVELFLLDERSYRDDQPCGDDALFNPGCTAEERDAEGRTFLGSTQKKWFKRGLRRSKATWKVIGNQLMVMSLDAPVGSPVVVDSWDGYGSERREVLSFIRDLGIQDVAFFTGDIHTFFAGDVTPSGHQGQLGAGEPAVATEFVCGSVTSLGVADTLGAQEQETLIALLGDTAFFRANDAHIKYSNLEKHGYGVMTAGRDGLDVSFRAVQTTRKPDSPVSTLRAFRVESGAPRVELV